MTMQSSTQTSLLEAFLQQPDIEASPAWEFLDGPYQKPIPTLYPTFRPSKCHS